MDIEDRTVLIYDSNCALCSWAVKLVLSIDSRDRIMLSSQHTTFAKEALAHSDINPNSTVIAVHGNELRTKSAAILFVLSNIGGFWATISKLIGILPTTLLDKGYDWVSKNRRVIGNTTTCPAVKAKHKHKFLL